MIALALLGALTIPMWANGEKAKVEALLMTGARPLTTRRIQRALKHAGYAPYNSTASRIVGDSRRFVIGLGGDGGDTCTFVVEPNGKLVQIDAAEASEGSNPILSERAQRVGKTLVVGGLYQWSGNGPRYSVRTFVNNGGAWTCTSGVLSESECWGLGKRVPLVKDSLITVNSRDYPRHMDACHATAQSEKFEIFRVRDGKVARDQVIRAETPYNRLDDLAGALDRKDASATRQVVPSASLRKRLVGIRTSVGTDPAVEFVGDYCAGDATTIGWSKKDGIFRDEKGRVTWFHFAKRGGHWVVAQIDERER